MGGCLSCKSNSVKDSPSLQQCHSKNIFVPSGQFKVMDQILIPPHPTLHGAVVESTLLDPRESKQNNSFDVFPRMTSFMYPVSPEMAPRDAEVPTRENRSQESGSVIRDPSSLSRRVLHGDDQGGLSSEHRANEETQNMNNVPSPHEIDKPQPVDVAEQSRVRTWLLESCHSEELPPTQVVDESFAELRHVQESRRCIEVE